MVETSEIAVALAEAFFRIRFVAQGRGAHGVAGTAAATIAPAGSARANHGFCLCR
jgi:hypothetical protein